MIEIKQLRKRSTNHEIVISEYIITIVHSKIVWKSSYSSGCLLLHSTKNNSLQLWNDIRMSKQWN